MRSLTACETGREVSLGELAEKSAALVRDMGAPKLGVSAWQAWQWFCSTSFTAQGSWLPSGPAAVGAELDAVAACLLNQWPNLAQR